MVDVRRTVRRLTVFDGVDIPFFVMDVVDVTNFLSAKLKVVSIGVNSVTYDVEVLYETGGFTTQIKFGIGSNRISDGTDIIDELVFMISLAVKLTDTHIRYSSNGVIVTNLLVIFD